MDKVLAQLAAQVEKLGAAAWDQAPLVYRDIIVSGLIANGLGVALGAGLLLAAVWSVRRAYREYTVPMGRCEKCGHVNDGDAVAAFALAAVGCGLIGLVIASACLPDLLTAWLAPRAYLIEYLR